jgi:hypothetical protein
MTETELRKFQHFSQSIEQAIRLANREVLHPVVDPLTQARILAIAIEVAKRRAAYIGATLRLGSADESSPTGEELRKFRMEFEEARDGFTALMAAIERSYIDVPTI